MKKFVIGLLSVFVMLGASILSACGSPKINLEVASQNVSIQLNDPDNDPTSVVSFQITGADDATIQTPYFTDKDIAKVNSVTYSTDGKGQVVIEGLNEGETQLVLTTQQGKVQKHINVEVYSEVIEIVNKKEDVENKSDRFAIKGGAVVLDANNFFNFEPATSNRKEVVWSFEDNGLQELNGATINENILSLPENFNRSEITLVATTHLGVSGKVTLTCLDKITTDEVDIGARKTKTESYQFLSTMPDDNKIVTLSITPNIGENGEDVGYVAVKYVGDLSISAVVKNDKGEICDDLIVVSENVSAENGLYEFSVRANLDKQDDEGNSVDINGLYQISFKIGYKEFNYEIDTDSLNLGVLQVDAKEQINGMLVTKDNIDATISQQTLYSSYSVNSGYGQLYKIALTPDTVIGASGQIKISVATTTSHVSDLCYVEMFTKSNGAYTPIDLTWDGKGAFVSNTIESTQNSILNHEIYIRANTQFLEEEETSIFNGINITIESVDNPNVKVLVQNIKLVKTTNEIVFENPIDEIFINSSSSLKNTIEFVLKGQTSLDGISVSSFSNPYPYIKISNLSFSRKTEDGEGVVFTVDFELDSQYLGLTNNETYFVFEHENGAVSDQIKFNIVYPLTDANVKVENQTNDVTMQKEDQDLFVLKNGELQLVENASLSKSVLMIKNGKTLPITHNFNKTITEISAVADIQIKFLDFVYNEGLEEDYETQLQNFVNRFNSTNGKIEIINSAENSSNIVSTNFGCEHIETTKVGYTYIVFVYTGINEYGEETSLYRVMLVESYEAITHLTASEKSFSIYAQDSVGNIEDFTKTITINFSVAEVSYKAKNNFNFVTEIDGVKLNGYIDSNNTIVWQDENGEVYSNKYFDITNVNISKNYIQFVILAYTTNLQQYFNSSLQIQYFISSTDNKLDTILGEVKTAPYSVNLDFTIINADRVEELIVDGVDEDGIYFEIQNSNQSSKTLLVKTSPTNAKDSGVSYFVIDSSGNSSNMVSLTSMANNRIRVDLSETITKGETGELYLFPSDAVYSNGVKYKYRNSNDEIVDGYLELINLNSLKSGTQLTNYQWLVENAFFINNLGEEISFKNFFHCYDILVADGLSFAHAYRVYSSEDLKNSSYFYTLMNDISIESASSFFDDFTGGLQGNSGDETISLNGGNFANTISKSGTEGGTIKNVKFNGNVTNVDGFVANINKGNIENVVVDTNGLNSSVLTSNSSYVGGIVGENSGLIKDSRVLGLIINGDTNKSTVGGIVGKNTGTIESCRVEFYNLLDSSKDDAYLKNTFTGKVVGGVIGEEILSDDKEIFQVYAYDYNLESDQSNTRLKAGTKGALVGTISGSGVLTFNECFALIDNLNTLNNFVGQGLVESGEGVSSNVTFTNCYISYYNESGYQSVIQKNSDRFISSGNSGFNANINGGKEYLRYFNQDEKVSSISLQQGVLQDSTTKLYKSLTDGQTIYFFLNKIDVDLSSLTSSQLQDYKELNTILIKDLLGVDNDNIIINSSSSNLIVSNSEIYVQSLSSKDFDLNLYSKHDVSNKVKLNASVKEALSSLVVISQTSSSSEEYVNGINTTINLQKTKSKQFVVNLMTTSVYLGNDATEFNLETVDKFTYASQSLDEGESQVSLQQISSNVFNVTSLGEVGLNMIIYPELNITEGNLLDVVKEKVGVSISVQPIDGAIEIGYTGDYVSISPSSVATVMATMKTTDVNDEISPVIYQVGANNTQIKLQLKSVENNVYIFENQNKEEVIQVTRSEIIVNGGTSEIKTKEYNFRFEIVNSYKSKISGREEYKVEFVSNSQLSSNQLTLYADRQDIAKVDISNYKVENASYTSNKVEYTTETTTTGIMAPRTSSIMQVSVNPDYSYYDYMEVTYENGIIADAVTFKPVVKSEGKSNIFETTDEIQFESNPNGNGFRYTPDDEDYKYNLYFLATFNAIPQDTTIALRVAYFVNNEETGEGEEIDYVYSYIFVSYLTEPTITIDGSDNVLLARGGSAEVKISVNIDQEVESINITNAEQGIDYVKISEEIDNTTNKRIYTYRLYASILAKAEGEDNRFYVNANVIRKINNQVETKKTTATVTLVDFKIDENASYLENAEDGTLDVYINVPQTLDYKYVFNPETLSYDTSDTASINAYEEIMDAREFLEENHYYPENASSNNDSYLINVEKEGEGINATYKEISLEERIYYVVGTNTFVPVSSSGINTPFVIEVEGGRINIYAKNSTQTSQQIMIRNYVTVNGELSIYQTFITLQTKVYSDEDLPLLIEDVDDFLSLAESESGDAQNYILMNDIVLDNYTPFDTQYISSFDGNGYTIFIRSFDTESQSGTLNLALFNNVSENTTLKNVRVNLYNGGDISVNVNNFTDINIAGFAIQNNGIITNCEVVSYYTDQYALGSSGLNESATYKKSTQSGLVVTYKSGNSTVVNMQETSSWSSKVAGFVLSNNGNITNSRVGGDKVIELGNVSTILPNQISARYVELETFSIVAQGQVAGFVLENQKNISASFVKNLAMENKGQTKNESKAYASGFVGVNNGCIITSYVEGVKQDAVKDENIYARLGSEIKSSLCVISGFVLTNNSDAEIKDSYSNIKISSTNGTNEVYLASGFVYRNEGYVENCYSASQIENQKFSQMNFSGVDETGNLLANGEYLNCYYYNQDYSENDSSSGSSTESDFDTNVLMVPDPGEEDYFYGFAISTYGNDDGIWAMDTTSAQEGTEGLKLIEPDMISISYRYKSFVDNESGEYVLPYGEIVIQNEVIKTTYGSENNPIIVRNAEEFIEVTGSSNSTAIQNQYNEKTIFGTYRLVDDIDMSAFSAQTITLPSTQRAFAGNLYGNGFTISNLSLSYNGQSLSYGLFKSIEPIYNAQNKISNTPRIVNLNVEVSSNLLAPDVLFVGTVAGYIKDSLIINLDINYSNNAQVQGKNFVGGLAGLVSNSSRLKNIAITNPSVQAVRFASSASSSNTYYNLTQINQNRTNVLKTLNYNYVFTGNDSIYNSVLNYSYAGGVAGYVDIYDNALSYFEYTESPAFNINNIKVNGIVNITGQVVGGLFGLTAHQTFIEDAGLTVAGTSSSNSSHIVTTKNYAGGVIGQSFGYLSKIFAEHEESVQLAIENNIYSYYETGKDVERGILNLFMPSPTEQRQYNQSAIGGLIGQIGSGTLNVAYSKLNVISTTADSAGGIVGETDLSLARSYLVDIDKIATEQYTRFLFNEVYSTGDVRASKDGQAKNSGGMIGTIAKSNDRVAFLASNAINFFSNIDYATGENYSQEELAQTVYQFVGGANENVSLSTAISFWGARKEGATGEESTTISASVGYVQDYKFVASYGENLVKINLYDGWSSTNNNEQSQYTYMVEGIYTYTSGTIGYQATQKVFLNSGVWSVENWSHSADRIFPEIKYSLADPSVIYLDAYEASIRKALTTMMQNPTVTVVVRGYTSENDQTIKDIPLYLYQKDYDITGFGGSIISSEEYIVQSENRQVRMIINDSLFTSTSTGFSITNTHVVYDSDGQSVITGGLISSSGITGASIDGLELYILDGVVIKATGSSLSAGLIAPTLTSSQINSLTIDTSSVTGRALSIQNENQSTSINAGLIAGTAVQDSETSVMFIRNVVLKTAKDSIQIKIENSTTGGTDNFTVENVNLGLYFGSASKNVDSESGKPKSDLRIEINSVSNGATLSTIGSGEINIGGFVGKVENLNSFGVSSQFDTSINLVLNSGANAVYAGGIFGKIEGGNTISFVGESNSVKTKITTKIYANAEIKIEKANLGGLIGYSNVQTSISGFEITPNIGEKITINSDSTSTSIPNAIYGGVIGYNSNITSLSSLVLNGDDGIVANSNENDVAVGSLIGYSSNNISSASGKSILSNVNVSVNSKDENSNNPNDYYVGGLVGYYSPKSSTTFESTNAYTGNITINLNEKTQTLYTGGIFGSIENSSANIKNSIFGGKIIIQKPTTSTNLYVGGTVGDTNQAISVSNVYNYGDVFVDYKESGTTTTTLQNYYFGGIIGNINSSNGNEAVQPTLNNCYSATTSHNARLAANNKVYALVGAGSISNESSNNYYSSAVCLAFDNQGIDIGYSAISNKGYGTTDNLTHILNAIQDLSQITSKSDFTTWMKNKDNVDYWYTNVNKLNPNPTNSKAIVNGSGYEIIYYNAKSLDNMSGKELVNVAVIGNFEDYDFDSSIASISGWSSISGINFNIKYDDDNINTENNTTSKTIYGGIVDTMSGNSIIYGIGVNGSMSIGGTSTVTMGGIVGQMTSGLIAESYTSLDMIYRAGKTGTISAIANYTSAKNEENQTYYTNAYINYTYATGAVATYIDANMYAFVSATSDKLNVSNSYTIAKLDWNDYTSDQTAPSGTTIGVFSGATKKNSYFDINGVNSVFYDKGNVKVITGNKTEELLKDDSLEGLKDTNNWDRAIGFNYGYPTRGFNYLKQSSWAERSTGDSTAQTNPITYDDCITTYTYTKVKNGATPEDQDATYSYMMIPNAGILANISNITANNFALMYDIELSNTQFVDEEGNVDWTSLGRTLQECELDGQDKTISGLNTSLFKALSGTVRNLRLTEIKSSTAALAGTISEGIVSNITLEGTISGGGAIGALANKIGNSSENAVEINTITSLVKVDSTDGNIGAIAGNVSGTVNINFCSNYGPLNTTGSGAAAGGIIGVINNYQDENSAVQQSQVTINYCFNGSSVLSGYTNTADESKNYYAGGIVGNNNSSLMTVTNCYNAGMVKAGNKKNTLMSYAAGIVAKSNSSASISNCYNEGPIEALGKDPETEFVLDGVEYEKDNNDNIVKNVDDNATISLQQTSSKNISAYYIANVNVTFCNFDNNVELSRNGAYLDAGKSYYTMNYKFPKKDFENEYMGKSGDIEYWILTGKVNQHYDNIYTKVFTGVVGIDPTIFYFTNVNFIVPQNGITNGDNEGQGKYILEYGENNIPTAFADYIKVKFSFNISMYKNDYRGLKEKSIEGSTYYLNVYDGKNTQGYFNKEYIQSVLYSLKGAPNMKNESTNSTSQTTKNGYSPSQGKYTTVNIGENEYYLADGYSEVFTSSTYTYNWDFEISGLTDMEMSNYEISGAKIGDTSVSPKIESIKINGKNDGVILSISLSAGTDFGDQPEISLSIIYNKTENINITNTNAFVYLNENSFAIDINKVNLEENTNINDYLIEGNLSTNEGQYNNVVKLTSLKNQDYYFVYDESENQLVYYFDAKYNNDGEIEISVNEKPIDFTNIYQFIINNFPTEFTTTIYEIETETLTCNNSIDIGLKSYNGNKTEGPSLNRGETIPSIGYDFYTYYNDYISIKKEKDIEENWIGFSISIDESVERLSIMNQNTSDYAYYKGQEMIGDALTVTTSNDKEIYQFKDTTFESLGEYIKQITIYYQLSGEINNENENTVKFNSAVSNVDNNSGVLVETLTERTLTGQNILEYNQDLFINGIEPSMTATNENDFAVVYSYEDSNNSVSMGLLNAGESIELMNCYNFKVYSTISQNVVDGDQISITYNAPYNFTNSETGEEFSTIAQYYAQLQIKNSNGELLIDWDNSTLYDPSSEEVVLNKDEFSLLKVDDGYYLFIKIENIEEIVNCEKINTNDNLEKKYTIKVNEIIESSTSYDIYKINGATNNFVYEISDNSINYDNLFNITQQENQITIKTIFQNANKYGLTINEVLTFEEFTSGKQKDSDEIEPKDVILTNDIFVLDESLNIDFNIYGNGYSMIVTGNATGNVFDSLGNTELTLFKDLYIAGTTNNATIATSSNATFTNVSVFGMLNYAAEKDKEFAGISMINADLYISMFNNGNEDKSIKITANSVNGHIIAADGKKFDSEGNGEQGGSIIIKSGVTVNESEKETEVSGILKAGDGANASYIEPNQKEKEQSGIGGSCGNVEKNGTVVTSQYGQNSGYIKKLNYYQSKTNISPFGRIVQWDNQTASVGGEICKNVVISFSLPANAYHVAFHQGGNRSEIDTSHRVILSDGRGDVYDRFAWFKYLWQTVDGKPLYEKPITDGGGYIDTIQLSFQGESLTFKVKFKEKILVTDLGEITKDDFTDYIKSGNFEVWVKGGAVVDWEYDEDMSWHDSIIANWDGYVNDENLIIKVLQ